MRGRGHPLPPPSDRGQRRWESANHRKRRQQRPLHSRSAPAIQFSFNRGTSQHYSHHPISNKSTHFVRTATTQHSSPFGVGVGGRSCSPPPFRPMDSEAVNRIHHAAKYVAKNGTRFEELMRTKEASNPKFAFLFPERKCASNEKDHAYYQWCLDTFRRGANPDDRAAAAAHHPRPRSPPPPLLTPCHRQSEFALRGRILSSSTPNFGVTPIRVAAGSASILHGKDPEEDAPAGLVASLVLSSTASIDSTRTNYEPIDPKCLPPLLPPSEPGRIDALVSEFYRKLEKLSNAALETSDGQSLDAHGRRKRRLWGAG